MTIPVADFAPQYAARSDAILGSILPACAATVDDHASYPPAWNFHWTLSAA